MEGHIPQSERELFEFYIKRVKPLYSDVQKRDKLPLETLHEINAALDHLSRIYTGTEEEQLNPKISIEKSYSHLKRSCLDIYKIAYRTMRRQVCVLRYARGATGLIDNGTFIDRMEAKQRAIKNMAKNARVYEANCKDDPDAADPHFGIWDTVYNQCAEFENEFFHHEKLVWSATKFGGIYFLGIMITAVIGFFVGLLF